MGDDWKSDIGVARDLERQLSKRQGEIKHISEADIDAALSADDPLAALRILAICDREREMIIRALARVRAIKEDLKSRRRVVERNAARRARQGSTIRS